MTSGTVWGGFGQKLGPSLALILPLVVLRVTLEQSGVPTFVILAVFLAIPFVAALVPASARLWPSWGLGLCFLCAMFGSLGLMPGDVGWGVTVGVGLTMGSFALLLQAATARIARRVARR